MNKTTIPILCLGISTGLFVSCQSQNSSYQISGIASTSVKPFPAWTKKSPKPQSKQQIKISSKLIEVSRPIGSPEIPSKRYERKLSDKDFQVLMRELAVKQGVDVLSCPSILAGDGEQAKLEITEEFVYPSNSDKVKEHQTEEVGIVSHYCADTDGKNITFKNATRIIEFHGFSKNDSESKLPLFNRRYVNSSSSLKNGQTFIVGGVVDDVIKTTEDKFFFNLFTKRKREKLSRELISATTVNLINVDGSYKE